MWPFGSSKAEDPPNRTERAKCHGSRDVYFACLRAQHLAKLDPTATEVKFFVPGKEGDSVCKKEREAYHANCPASWVRSLCRHSVDTG